MATTILGRERLRRKLRALPAAAREEIAAAMAKGADEIVAMAKRLAPVDSGALRDSIGWSWGDAPRGAMVLAQGGSGDLRITIYAGNNQAFYARWQEFGTTGMRAQPFFFPAYRALRKRTKSRINRGIKRAAQRVAAGG